MPFREDIKRFTFPPLDRVVNREGKELTEHSTLPSKEMRENMDELVDSMDLMDAEEGGALDGDDGPWFRSEESFNPAIHLIKDAVSWRVFHPDDKLVPKPHPEVEKFLERPHKVVERSRNKAKRCRELFDLEYGEFAFSFYLWVARPSHYPVQCLRWRCGRRRERQRISRKVEKPRR